MSTATHVPGRSRFRWAMLGLTWLLYVSFGLTVGSIPPLVKPIVADLGMTYAQMGLVLGAWQLVYIVTAYPLGLLVDRLGVRRSLGLGIFIMWLSLVLRGLSGDFVTLFLAVALFGVGGPIVSIGAPKMVSLWFQGHQRGLAAGVYTTGPVGGMALALATAGSVVMPLTGTWRGVSLVYGAVVLAVMAGWWLFSRDTGSPAEGSSDHPPGASRGLLRIRNVQLLLVFAVATFLLNHGLDSWVPTLLNEGGMTLAQAGYWTAMATAIGVLGVLFIPNLARYGYRTLLLGGLLSVAAVATASLTLLEGLPLVGSLMVLAVARSPLMPVLVLVLMETPGVGALRMGAAAGLFFAAAEVGGFGGPFLLGSLRDVTGSLVLGVLVLSAGSASLILLLPFVKERRDLARMC